MNILIVDDDNSSIAALTNLLEYEHNLKIASNGYDGFEQYKASHYDVVITDVMMPKMNGIELLKSIRNLDRDISVIVLTGYPTDKNIHAIKKYEATFFFAKPLDVENFMETLSNIENISSLNKNKKGIV